MWECDYRNENITQNPIFVNIGTNRNQRKLGIAKISTKDIRLISLKIYFDQ